jgi:alkanesulfonate monooxygenase SsuD/methylene tetrahydromethanopterin reductase-like flavin-dependent oxidoreductase (luciferase family)
MKFNLIAELRNPPQWNLRDQDVCADILDHMVAAEELGFHRLEFGEHHFAEDGYLPSPLMAAAAVAARTTRIRVGSNIILMNLYDLRRLAEDTAVLDIVSGGRLDLGVGLGYREAEYAGYGVDFKSRASRLDEGIEILLRLWHGETVTFRGKHYELNGVRTTPSPVQRPHPPLWIGAFSRPGIARVAKYGDGYTGPANEELCGLYLKALAAQGKDPAQAQIKGITPGPFFVSEDPERTFELMLPHMLYWVNMYAKWMQGTNVSLHSAVSNADELRAMKVFNVMTPEDAVVYLNDLQAKIPLESVSLWITLPGLPVKSIWDHWELFARKVMPYVE